MPNKWKLLNQKKIYNNPFLTVFEESLERGDGKEVNKFYSVARRDAAFILSLTKDKKVPLVFQYKNGVKEVIWELPAGFVEEKEAPEEAARRELLEETGYQAKDFELLGKFAPNPSISNNRNFVFFAKDAEKVAEQKLDTNEDIEVRLFSFEELTKSIIEGKSIFIDLQSQFSLLLLKERLKTL